MLYPLFFSFFFFNDTATTEIYTLSLHDALPIFSVLGTVACVFLGGKLRDPEMQASTFFGSGALLLTAGLTATWAWMRRTRSEEHTSELQSRLHLVCRLLLEKKNNIRQYED